MSNLGQSTTETFSKNKPYDIKSTSRDATNLKIHQALTSFFIS